MAAAPDVAAAFAAFADACQVQAFATEAEARDGAGPEPEAEP